MHRHSRISVTLRAVLFCASCTPSAPADLAVTKAAVTKAVVTKARAARPTADSVSAMETADVKQVYSTVVDRAYKPPQEPNIARDGRWLLQLYDKNLTRTEMMVRDATS